MLGNLYSKDGKRLLVEKQLSHDYVTCKQWFKGNVVRVSMTVDQLKHLTFICKI